MFRMLNKISGSVFGVFLYPLKSLFINLLFAGLTVLLFVLGMVVLPPFMAIEINNTSRRRSLGTILLLIFLISPSFLLFALSSQAFSLVQDLFTSIRLGAIEGYNEGLFFHVFKQTLTSFVIFSRPLQRFIDYLNNLSKNQNEVPILGESQQQRADFLPLTDEEIKLADEITDLKVLVYQYNDLHNRLQKLDEALGKRRAVVADETSPLEDLDGDEVCVHMDIIVPSLFSKEYEYEPSKWRVVPASTKIIDWRNLDNWKKTKNIHPLTRDSLNVPEKHLGKPTQYIVQPYQTMNDCGELKDAAAIIRKKLNSPIPSNLLLVKQIANEINRKITHPLTFFGTATSNNSSTVIDEDSDEDFTRIPVI